MSFFADMMAHDGHMAFEKCGDVVVSPKDNKLALFCHFCKDLITNLPQFLRHLHEAHGDVLHFTKEHNVYSVDELLSGEEAGEDVDDAQEMKNNSQGEDCGMPQVAEELNDSEKSKNTSDIDLPDEKEEESPGSTKDLIAEVEAMLLSDEIVEEPQETSQQELAMKAYVEICQGMQEKKEAPRKPIIPKTESENQRSKGGRDRRDVGLRISRLRSHAIARQSRKRMGSVKKRILRAIDNFVPKDKSLQLAPIRPKRPLSNTPSRPPTEASHLSVRKSTLTTARISLQMTTTTTTSSETVVSCSNEQETSYQASSQSVLQSCQSNEKAATCQENEIFTQSTRKSTPIEIQKVEILPKLQNENSDDKDIEEELAALLGSRMRSNLKENKESPAKGKKSRTEFQKLNKDIKSYSINRTPLKATNVENKLDILFAEMDSLKRTPTNTDPTLDGGNESIEVLIDNCTLLKYVGLPVIHIPSYEDKIMLDELEDLRVKAAKFCEVFKKHDEIWNCRRSKGMANDPQRLASSIVLLTQEVNEKLNCHLSTSDVKRILNLITLWFWKIVDLKHFRKLPLSSSIQHYSNLFAFIPQLTRFLFFCEFCDEIFSLEAAYRRHLMSHSFTIRCAICRRAFKSQGYLDKHLKAYNADLNILEHI